MVRMNLSKTLPFLFLILATGCYELPSFRDMSFGKGYSESLMLAYPDEKAQSFNNETVDNGTVLKGKPWEVFQKGLDLNGMSLRHRFSLRGDELFEQGLQQQAINEYVLAQKSGAISPAENEALVLRIASLELSQDKPKEALRTLSEYFEKENINVSRVKAPFAIVFGYAYGRSGNVEQALAWFSHANKKVVRNENVREAAYKGVELILKTVTDAKLTSMAEQWVGDNFILMSINKEERRRTETLTPLDASAEFEGVFLEKQELAAPITSKVAALLPLTGAYAALGESVKNGISLVFNPNNTSSVDYLDTYGDGLQAASYVHGMVSRNESPVIIGPLLAAPAIQASNVARQANIPMIVLSKRSDFVTKGSIFRLGTTTESQVSSILSKAYGTFNLTNFAVIYPANETGLEYANTFERIAQKMRLNVVYKASYQKGNAESFIAIGKAIEQLNIQGLFLPSDIDTAVTFMQSLSEEVRTKIKLLGTPAWDDLAKLDRARHLMNNAIFPTPFFMNKNNPLVQNFISAYRDKFSMDPDFMAAQGFDVATLVHAAFQKQKSDNVDFIQALESISRYDGVTGVISSTGTGELSRNLTIVQYQNGQLMEVLNNDKKRESPLYVAY